MRGRRHGWLWWAAGGALSFVFAAPFPRQAGGAAGEAAQAVAGEEPVRAELFADASAVAAGRPFKVGVLFRIAPDWHIYWKYPGDAGLPTAVTLELPQRFVAGEIEWPLPQEFIQPGDLVGYGYTGSVMLMTEVTPPDDLAAGTEFAIRAKVQWLSCRDVCRPGRAELNAKLAVAPERAPANEALFREWAARLPRTEKEWMVAGPLRSVAATTETLPPNPGSSGAQGGWKIRIGIMWAGPPAKVEFFPAPTDAVLTDRPSVNTSGNQTEIVMAARPSGTGPADHVECLTVFTLPDGERGGFPLTLKLSSGNAAPSSP